MRKIVSILFVLLLALQMNAQSIKKVHGEYIYHAPENVTPEQAKQTALQRAKVQALADEFGTVVTQNNATRVENNNGQSDIGMISLGGSEVKGEWIETIGEPQFELIGYENGTMVWKCTVTGKAREIVSDKPIFDAHLLRNGTEGKFKSDEFRSGDDLFLQFRSPVDGYLNVYLDDGQGHVAAMLPYRSQGFGATEIKGNKDYTFFSAKGWRPRGRRVHYDLQWRYGTEPGNPCILRKSFYKDYLNRRLYRHQKFSLMACQVESP